MTNGPAAAGDEGIRRLVEKLEAIRASLENRPDGERDAALGRAVRSEIEGVSPDQAARRLDGLRAFLASEARRLEHEVGALTTELNESRRQTESLRAERDRLAEELGRVRAGSGGAPTDEPGSTATLEKIREGLRRITEYKEVSSDSLGLTGTPARFFRLVAELMSFALNLETGLQELQRTFEVGPVSQMATQVFRKQLEVVRNRFRSCLNDEEGSVKALKEALAKNTRFVVDLNGAYDSSISSGSRDLLDRLDPQPILDNHKGMLGVNYQDAWKELGTIHSDLVALPKEELWKTFFERPFKEKLSEPLSS